MQKKSMHYLRCAESSNRSIQQQRCLREISDMMLRLIMMLFDDTQELMGHAETCKAKQELHLHVPCFQIARGNVHQLRPPCACMFHWSMNLAQVAPIRL